MTASTLFSCAHASHPQWRIAAASVLQQLRTQLALPTHASTPTLGLLYITEAYAGDAAALLEFWRSALPEVTDWSGCSAGSIAAGLTEYHHVPAMAVMLLDVPAHQYRVFSGVAPLPLLPGGGFGAAVSDFTAHTALVHADGRMTELSASVQEMADRTHAGVLWGGVSGGSLDVLQFAVAGDGNLPGHGSASGVFSGGLSGVAFSADVAMHSRLAQGCRTLGAPMTITATCGNVVQSLDGRRALDVLRQVRHDDGQRPHDTSLPPRKMEVTHVAVREERRATPRPENQHPGYLGAETRVAPIIGLDTTQRGIALAEPVRVGAELLFCQRDAATARAHLLRSGAELRELLVVDAAEVAVDAFTDVQAGRASSAPAAVLNSFEESQTLLAALAAGSHVLHDYKASAFSPFSTSHGGNAADNEIAGATTQASAEPAASSGGAGAGHEEATLPSAGLGAAPLAADALLPPGTGRIRGAIYVSCRNRGGEFFGGNNAEMALVRQALGDVPVICFFGRGEIYQRSIHRYAGVLTVFTDGDAAASSHAIEF